MAVINHKKTILQPDTSDNTLLQPSNWNDTHTITFENSDRENLGLGEADTPTFAALIILDNLGNKWRLTATEDGNLSLDPLMLP